MPFHHERDGTVISIREDVSLPDPSDAHLPKSGPEEEANHDPS